MGELKLLDVLAGPWIAALVNSIGESLVVTAAVALILRFLKRLSASTRYAVWWLTMAAAIALCVLNFAAVPVHRDVPAIDRASVSIPVVEAPGPTPAPTAHRAAATTIQPPVDVQPEKPHWTPVQIETRWLPVGLGTLWILATLVMLARMAAGIISLICIKKTATPAPEVHRRRILELTRPRPASRVVEVGSSAHLRTPVAAGLYRPAILIPSSLLPELSDAEFDQIALHELAHIERWDDWANLIQRLIVALFVFHPAVRLISRKLDLEREIACDDRVLEQTGQPRDYAACLTRLVEITGWARQSVPAPGATLHKAHIVQRVEKLLDRRRNANPHVTKRVVVTLCLTLATLVLLMVRAPALWAFADPPDDFLPIKPESPKAPVVLLAAAGQNFSSSTSISNDGRHTKIRWTQGSRTFDIEVKGDVEFTDNDHDIKTISPGGSFRMEEQGSPDKRYEVKADGSGNITRTYFENGHATNMTDAGRQWLTERMPEMIRETGAGAQKRVQRILKQQGADAAASEIRLIRSDGSKRIYLQEYLLHGGLDETHLRGGMRLARGISSDGEKRELLASVASLYLKDDLRRDLFDAVDSISSDGEHARVIADIVRSDPENKETLLLSARSAGRISSDGDKAGLLVSLAERYKVDGELRGAWFTSLNTVSSDGEKRRALSAIVQSAGKDRETLADAMKSASGISSDGERAALLIESSAYYVEDPVVRRNFFAAVDGISSDGEKRKALAAIYQRSNQNKATVKLILRSAKGISSDGEKAALLVDVAGGGAWDPDNLEEFFQACDSISSDGEHSHVLLRALERSHGSTPLLVKILASSDRISSDGEKARVLTQVIKLNPRDAAVRSALRKSIDGVSSDGEKGRLATALLNQG